MIPKTLRDAVRMILAHATKPLSPGQIKDRVKVEFPQLFDTEAQRAAVARGNYQSLDHALLGPIYGIVTHGRDFVVDRSGRPMRVTLAHAGTNDGSEATEVEGQGGEAPDDVAADMEADAAAGEAGAPSATGRLRPVWFVGASFHGTDDQSARFLESGLWEIATPTAAESAVVREMRPGDPIVIKSTFVRWQGLGFDNRGHAVSVMRLKAVGVITDNPGDGERVSVRWRAATEPRDWFFHTYRRTIWRVMPGTPDNDALIAFALDGEPQELAVFRNAPGRAERFGDRPDAIRRFAWTTFYEAVATALRRFANDRSPLVRLLQDLATRHATAQILDRDIHLDGGTGFVRDIDPFTTMGLFNRGTTDENRRALARDLARALGVTVDPPATFEAIPVLNNLRSWFFPLERDRDPGHIDALWRVFGAALDAQGLDDEVAWATFDAAFDDAMGRPMVSWNLTMALYWARPWEFLPFDERTRLYVRQHIGLRLPKGWKASDYRRLMEALSLRFQEPGFPVHAFPELSLAAFHHVPSDGGIADATNGDEEPTSSSPLPGDAAGSAPTPPIAVPLVPYTVENIAADGCFLSLPELQALLARLREKRNLILQGPPGTGKTWLARRLAYSLMGYRDDSRVTSLQFHPALTYEDFVRGWRPGPDGRLVIEDGSFLREVDAARRSPDRLRVVVIEEINRGQPAQVFGEMLTLIEAGKRSPDHAMQLGYPGPDGRREPVYVPENLFVIGTMNVADRSIALVDLALRRRFAFVTLEPRLGPAWRRWVQREAGIEPHLADDIEQRLATLNGVIENDPRLGPAYRVGHSYVTPEAPPSEGVRPWFRQVVDTEIGPLLEEYWSDAPADARRAREQLLAGW